MNHKPRILVVGSFVMDLIVESDRFVRAGETILGTRFSTASGGKGANQAMQAALLGADVTMVGCVGDDDFGHRMLSTLSGAGVDVSRVHVTNQTSSAIGNIQIQRAGDTQNRIVVVPGANMVITPQDVSFLEASVADYDMVMLQLEIPMEVNEAVARYASARGIPVMLNPAPFAPLSDAMLRHITYLSPNEHEAADYVGFAANDDASARQAAIALRNRGVQNVLVTLGERGALYASDAGECLCHAVRCDHVADPTAAGDSFVGSFCFGIALGMEPREAMTLASHAASITVSRMGAQPSLPTLDEVAQSITSHGGDASRLIERTKG